MSFDLFMDDTCPKCRKPHLDAVNLFICAAGGAKNVVRSRRRLLRHRHFAVHRFEMIGMKSDEKTPAGVTTLGSRMHAYRTDAGAWGWEAPGICIV